MKKNNIGHRFCKCIIRTVVIAAAVLSCLLSSSCLSMVAAQSHEENNPFIATTFDGEEYAQCRALVNDVRNDNFDLIIEDVINMEGDFEDYNFLVSYEQQFKEIVPDDTSDKTAILYRNCCFFVSYTEFLAKKYENYSNSGLLASLYVDDAEKYRSHADTLWDKLEYAQTEEHLQSIIDYCKGNDIIYLKEISPSMSDVAAE